MESRPFWLSPWIRYGVPFVAGLLYVYLSGSPLEVKPAENPKPKYVTLEQLKANHVRVLQSYLTTRLRHAKNVRDWGSFKAALQNHPVMESFDPALHEALQMYLYTSYTTKLSPSPGELGIHQEHTQKELQRVLQRFQDMDERTKGGYLHGLTFLLQQPLLPEPTLADPDSREEKLRSPLPYGR